MSPFRIIHIAFLSGWMLLVLGGLSGWQTSPGYLLGYSGLAIVVVVGYATLFLVTFRCYSQVVAWLGIGSYGWNRLARDIERLDDWLHS